MSSERKIAANRYNGRKGRGLAALGNGNAIDSDAVDFLAAMICDEDQNMGGGPGDRPQRARFASYLRAANRTHRTDADTIALAKRDSLARRRIAKPMQHVNKSKFSFPKRLINTAIGFDHKISIQAHIPTGPFPRGLKVLIEDAATPEEHEPPGTRQRAR
jgi:hypothetical protein